MSAVSERWVRSTLSSHVKVNNYIIFIDKDLEYLDYKYFFNENVKGIKIMLH